MPIRRSVRVPWRPLLVIALGLIAAVALWRPLSHMLADMESAREWLAALGPWGPIALIAVNAAQIVFAPIPGYFVQMAGGYLFGAVPGALYGLAGMLIGGALAMVLARRLGRPFVERWLGAERVARWEHAVHADALWVWFLLMASPVGDAPYYLAGLTRIPIWKLLGVVLLTRGPSVGIVAAVGAGAIALSPRLLLGALLAILLAGLLLYRTGRRIAASVEERVLRRARRTSES